MNNNYLAFWHRVACIIVIGFIAIPLAGCGGSENTVVEPASDEELMKSEAELSGVTEEEYEQGMNEL